MPTWFDAEVAELEARTRHRQGEEGLVLFYGSSTFTLWSALEAEFPRYRLVNHGFGGATLADCIEYFDRLVTPMRPAAIVLYAGDNDLGNGDSPEQVCERVEHFVLRKRAALGPVPLAYVSLKISPARLQLMHTFEYANRIIARSLFPRADARFLDITRRMVSRGLPQLRCCFAEDPLHMSERGYAIWSRSLNEYLDSLNGAVWRAPAPAETDTLTGEAPGDPNGSDSG